jgi:hypothetical protein
MLKKIIFEQNYIPDKNFDWTLRPNERFVKLDSDHDHSSISSCDDDISEGDDVEAQMRENIQRQLCEYSKRKHLSYPLFQVAFPPQGEGKYFKIP